MKYLVFGLTFAAVALAQHPKVSECFKVNEMIRADEAHYWTTWTNSCPYTIDSVYVMVRFADHASKEVADGVWSLHFIAPGAHRTMRFSAPGKLADFASVRQHRITSDMSEAFGRNVGPVSPPMSSIEMAAVSAYRQAVVKDGSRVGRAMPVSAVIADPGERAYQMEPPAAKATSSTAEATFRSDFPDPWRAVLSAQESAVSPASRASFVRFVSEEKPIFQ